jgi:hypothetical protein
MTILALESKRRTGSKPCEPALILSLKEMSAGLPLRRERIDLLFWNPGQEIRRSLWHTTSLLRMQELPNTFIWMNIPDLVDPYKALAYVGGKKLGNYPSC